MSRNLHLLKPLRRRRDQVFERTAGRLPVEAIHGADDTRTTGFSTAFPSGIQREKLWSVASRKLNIECRGNESGTRSTKDGSAGRTLLLKVRHPCLSVMVIMIGIWGCSFIKHCALVNHIVSVVQCTGYCDYVFLSHALVGDVDKLSLRTLVKCMQRSGSH
jgi:hypothetical protein